MIKISICICTRNRKEELKNLLLSLNNLEVPPEAIIDIIIVENDSNNFSENIITEFASSSKFIVRYFLEPDQGISFARNRSVKEANNCDFCCFVDDDQVVAQDWLVELVKCQREFDADGVWGTYPPIFHEKVPSQIRQFHTPILYDYGIIVNYAGTGGLLLRKVILDKIDGPFDIRLSFSGGEDIYLSYQISKLGGIIRCNPNALAYEIIPHDRTTIKYILKRCYRNSNTSFFVKSLIAEKFNRIRIFFELSIRLSFGLLIVIPFLIFGKSNALKGLIKICNAIGGFSFLIGRKNQFYK
jgi:succinoglycan biosynthesis protein ExoM